MLSLLVAAGIAWGTGNSDFDVQKRRHTHSKPDAQVMLEDSLRQAKALNVIAIITLCSDCDEVTQRLKLEQRAQGEQFRTVIQPLSMQGISYFESGDKSMMYLPDQRVLFETKQADEDADIARRMELAARNYEMEVETEVDQDVAGRKTFCVVAKPKVAGLPERQFYLDQKTLYPLRYATSGENGQWKVSMDTQVVDFPKETPDIRFDHIGVVRKIKFNPVLPLDSVPNVDDRLGFDPVVPKKLPLGFEIQRSELRSNEEGQVAMLWLTDGFASARVYEFRDPSRRAGIWSVGSTTGFNENGVTTMMISDLSSEVRRQLLQAFAHRSLRAIAPPDNPPAVGFGDAPPVPVKEPNVPEPLFSTPEPGSDYGCSSEAESGGQTSPQGQSRNVKGDR